ncbi:MAG: hypothetical protein NVS2B8_19100 [Vulcanimicrobiaceae bacterium]
MFTQTTAFYDKIYAAAGKTYAGEAAAVAAVIRDAVPRAQTVLDVGCGTGAHLAEFARLGLSGRGIDVDFKMVTLARSRLPDATIEPGDMTNFKLSERFDAIVALGAMAYARIPARLDLAIARMAEHLRPLGALVVDPSVSFAEFRPGTVDGIFVDEPDLKIARMSLSKQMGKIAILDFHYLVATLTGVERYFERHELGLFDESEYRHAFEKAGLDFETVDAPSSPEHRFFVGRR